MCPICAFDNAIQLLSCLQGSLLKCCLLCVGGFAAANLLRRGARRRRLPSSPVKPCCVCVCVCVCVWSRCLCVWGWGGGQISPSGGQDGASCGRGATRSAPVGEHLRQGSRLGLAARQTGRGGRGLLLLSKSLSHRAAPRRQLHRQLESQKQARANTCEDGQWPEKT